MRAKLGLLNPEADDGALVEELLDCMHRHGADFTIMEKMLGILSQP
jgi:uncharacterized protein YdiU (UPF0061 family)